MWILEKKKSTVTDFWTNDINAVGNLEKGEKSKLNPREPSVLKWGRKPHMSTLTFQFLPPSALCVYKLQSRPQFSSAVNGKDRGNWLLDVHLDAKIYSFQMENQRRICKGGR